MPVATTAKAGPQLLPYSRIPLMHVRAAEIHTTCLRQRVEEPSTSSRPALPPTPHTLQRHKGALNSATP